MLVAPKQTRIQSILSGSQASNRKGLNAESNRIDSYLKERAHTTQGLNESYLHDRKRNYCTYVDELHHEALVDEVIEVLVVHRQLLCDPFLVLFVLLLGRFRDVLASILVVLFLLVLGLVALKQLILILIVLALGVCIVLAVGLVLAVGIVLSP